MEFIHFDKDFLSIFQTNASQINFHIQINFRNRKAYLGFGFGRK